MRVNQTGHKLAEQGKDARAPAVGGGILVSGVGGPKFLRSVLLVY